MPILKDLVQVLRVYEHSNTSVVAVLLGRRLGQFRVLAKGLRRWPKKGFEGGLDLLVRGEILVYPRPGDNLWLFKEWDEHARPKLGRSPRMLNAASYLCEFTEALTRPTAGSLREPGPSEGADAATPRLYDLMAATVDALAGGAPLAAMLTGFTLNALQIEGLLPPLERCANCDKPFFGSVPRAALPLAARAVGSVPRAALPLAARAVVAPTARAWLSSSGLTCDACLVPLAQPPARATRTSVGSLGGLASAGRHGKFALASPHTAAGKPVAPNERGLWLRPETHKALLHIQATAKPLTMSARAASELAQALTLLVHGALERDLRTLPHLARIIG